jgi:23S rRNA-/tRNA-specific pseudouridylate synthase
VVADKGQEPLRVDKFLLNRLEGTSRNKIQQASLDGFIRVNDKAVKSNYKVKPFDVVSVMFTNPPREIELIPQDIPLNIVYEDDDIVILNKEAGMVVHPGYGNYKDTLVNALTYHFKNLPNAGVDDGRPGLVHRIDKNTTGLMIIAKNEVAMNSLSTQFFERTIDRKYYALVWGNFDDDVGSIEGHIGRSLKNRKVMTSFLHPEFKFRFHNEATLSGNFDHWHIDQVLLTEDLDLHNDNEDISFVYETAQMLNFYTSIPWSHFDNNRLAYMSLSMESKLRNNYTSPQSVDYRYDVYDQNNNSVYHYPTTGPTRNDEIPPFDGTNFSYTNDSPSAITVGVNAFPTTATIQENNSFTIVQSIATDDNNLFKQNDSMYYVQSFNNYYSLDDGSAEASYGINAEGGQVAMLFNIGQQDTLKAVQFHFEQNYEDNTGLAFSICLWESQSGVPGSQLYQSQIVYPEYATTKNGFFEYVLEEPIEVSGAVFVGWNQYYDEIINVGLDKNTINNDRMFYNLGSSWNTSSCAECSGTWMIRPVFGNLTVSAIEEINSNTLSIFPNPASQFFQIDYNEPLELFIFDLNGQELFSTKYHTEMRIDVSWLSKGLYLVKMISQHSTRFEKLLVQ